MPILLFWWALGHSAMLSASCCSSAATLGVGRLLKHERAMIQMSTDARYLFGSFDKKNNFSLAVPVQSPKLKFNPNLALMTRVFGGLEPFIKISQDTGLSTGSRLAIKSCSLISFIEWPLSPNHADYALLSNALLLEHSFKELLWAFGYAFGAPLYIIKNNEEQFKEGFKHSPVASLGFSARPGEFLNFLLSADFYTKLSNNNEKIADSEKRKLSMALAYSKKIHSHVSISTSAGSEMPILGKNINTGFFLNLSLRLGVF